MSNLVDISTGTRAGTKEPAFRSRQMLPQIVINHLQTHEAATALMEAIALRNDPPFLFRKDQTILRMYPDGVCKFVDLHALQGMMDKSALIYKLDKKGVLTPGQLTSAPPRHVLSDDLSGYGLPVLKDVIHTPILLKTGRVLDKLGYDVDSGLYLSLPDDFVLIPRPAPSKEAAKHAYSEIARLLKDFPFANASGLTNAMAFIVGIAAKNIIDNKFPLALNTGQMAYGAGKTLLAQTILAIATGTKVPIMALPDSNDQVKKLLLSYFRNNPIGTIFDNVKSHNDKPINFASLNSALTAGETSDRVLQSSKNVTIDLRGHPVIMNGNNLTLGFELMRRTLAITFSTLESDSTKRRPEGDYKPHDGDNLVKWCLDQRSEINAQLLTILESWADEFKRNGLPGAGSTRILPSYEAWSEVVGSVLSFCDVAEDFMGDRDEAMAEHADGAKEEYAFVGAIMDSPLSSKPFQANELLRLINENTLLTELIPTSLSEKFSRSGSKATALGHWLKERRGTSFGVDNDISLQRKEALSRTGTAIWQFVNREKS